jgi:hypothetical protein
VVSEQTQAQYLRVAAQKYFACDPSVAAVNLFLLEDESTRDGRDATGAVVGGGWQSGLLTAGGEGISTPKQAYSALAPLFAAGRSACTGPLVDWTPAASGKVGPTSKAGAKGKGKGKSKGAPPFNGLTVPAKPPLCSLGTHSTKQQPCRKK